MAIVVTLGTSAGAGFLQVFNSAGQPVVDASVLQDGTGMVTADPKYTCVPPMIGATVAVAGVPDCREGRLM